MKIYHVFLILILGILNSSCLTKTIEVIVEDTIRYKPDIYEYTVTITDEKFAKLFLTNTARKVGKDSLSLAKLSVIISEMDGVEINQGMKQFVNELIGEGIEMEILLIKGEREFKNLKNRLKKFGNYIGRITRAESFNEIERERDLLTILLNEAKQKAEFIALEQKLTLGKIIKIEEVGKTVAKKKKRSKKIEPNGFEILNEKFIEDIDIPRLDRKGNMFLKKKIKVIYRIEK